MEKALSVLARSRTSPPSSIVVFRPPTRWRQSRFARSNSWSWVAVFSSLPPTLSPGSRALSPLACAPSKSTGKSAGYERRSSDCSRKRSATFPAKSVWEAREYAMASRHERVTIAATGELDGHRVPRLPVLVLNVHSSCNCRCLMCDIWKTKEGRAFRPSDLEPHLESIRRLGVRWVVFSGGEPLLNQDLPLLCSILRRENVRLTLLTTGLLLGKYAAPVAHSVDDAIVSLDGPEHVHNAVRRIDGAFTLLRSGVSAVRQQRPAFPITARTTVQKANHRHLRE